MSDNNIPPKISVEISINKTPEAFKIWLSWYAYSKSNFLRVIACDVIEAIQREGEGRLRTVIRSSYKIISHTPWYSWPVIGLIATMPFCAAFGCPSVHKKGCGVSFFSFPKDSARRKRWTIFCRRDKFVPENHSRLCSKHFSTDQLERDPNVLGRLGYANARIRLKGDAVPDVPLRVQAAPLVLPPKTRWAFAKRNKPYLLHEALQDVELRNGNDATPVTIHHDGEAPPNSEPETAFEVPEPEDPPVSSSQTCTTLTKKCQASITVPQRTSKNPKDSGFNDR